MCCAVGQGASDAASGWGSAGLGQRAFERLEGALELVGMELLGLLGEQRAAQLAQQMFQASALLGERGHLAAQALDHRFGLSAFECAGALNQRRVLRLKPLDDSATGGRKQC